MKIPTEFYLFGCKWKVVFDNDMLDNAGNYGECRMTEKTIYLASKSHGKERPQESIGETFYHELTHAILDSAGYEKLSKDERMVSLIGRLLHQVEFTKKCK